MSYLVTMHAVERYRERFASDLTLNDAVAELTRLVESGKRLPRRAASGASYLMLDPARGVVAVATWDNAIESWVVRTVMRRTDIVAAEAERKIARGRRKRVA